MPKMLTELRKGGITLSVEKDDSMNTIWYLDTKVGAYAPQYTPDKAIVSTMVHMVDQIAELRAEVERLQGEIDDRDSDALDYDTLT